MHRPTRSLSKGSPLLPAWNSRHQLAEDCLKWIVDNGGYVHPDLELRIGRSQEISVWTVKDIDPGVRLISCPFELAVTPDWSKHALIEISRQANRMEEIRDKIRCWNDRMSISAYIAAHKLYQRILYSGDQTVFPQLLKHSPYTKSLPSHSDIRTPDTFWPAEVDMLKGTNLYGAVVDRIAELRREHQEIKSTLLEDLTWDLYLDAVSSLSSRSFPSQLLRTPESGSTSTSAVQTPLTEESHPCLLPGVDMFNHQRGHPITWLSSVTPSSKQHLAKASVETISLVTATGEKQRSELFNNYGPKSNEELLMGYGFVIPNNPDDHVVLKLGSMSINAHIRYQIQQAGLDMNKQFFIKRDGILDPEMINLMRIILTPPEADPNAYVILDEDDEHTKNLKEQKSFDLELDVMMNLAQMLDSKQEKAGPMFFELASNGGRNWRPEVAEVIKIYRQGQVDILTKAIEVVEERVDRLEGLVDEGMMCSCCS